MNDRDRALLHDMLSACHKSQAFIRGKNQDAFKEDDELIGFAVARAIEIIGEAANHLSSELRASHPQIDWSNIIGMRHKIVHDYLDVDYEIMWRVVTVNVPRLIVELQKILDDSTNQTTSK